MHLSLLPRPLRALVRRFTSTRPLVVPETAPETELAAPVPARARLASFAQPVVRGCAAALIALLASHAVGAFAEAPASPSVAPVPAPAAPAPAPAPPAPAAPAPSAPAAGTDEAATEQAQAFDRDHRTVEEDVGTLKERVFRSKATLEMLKELILEGAQVGARVSIWHVNQIGGAYSVEAAQYWFDGRSVFSKSDPQGSLNDLKETEVYQGSVAPGKHKIQVSLVLRGSGYKVFSYLRSYQFRVQSTYDFDVDQGKSKIVRVLAGTKSGVHSFTDRPEITYAEQAGSLE
jgi:hypothetical protein